MAQVFALPLGNDSDSLKELKESLISAHKYSLIIKIDRYLGYLKEFGFLINKNIKRQALKKLKKELYELRVDCIRLMLYFDGNDFFVILHGFVKDTQKTPKNHIKRAEEEIRKWKKLWTKD